VSLLISLKRCGNKKLATLLQDFKTWLHALQQQGVANEKTRMAITYFLILTVKSRR
jgi:hypothetical protein